MDQQFMEQREVNTDPRETRLKKINPGAPRQWRNRRQGGWKNIVIVLTVLGAIVASLVFVGLLAPTSTSALSTQNFQVSGQSKLVVKNEAGKIAIHAGNVSTITVRGTRNAHGIGADVNAIKMNTDQQGNTVTLTSDTGWGLSGSRSIDLDITVPRTTDLNLNDVAGTILVEDISGHIDVTNVSGKVDIENSSGEMDVNSTSGGIVVNQSHLQGQSHLATVSGGIRFDGSLDPQGNYTLQAISGGVKLMLPSDASFHLETSLVSGHVTNQFGGTDVGVAPQPLLSIRTTSGGIAINKR